MNKKAKQRKTRKNKIRQARKNEEQARKTVRKSKEK